MLTWRAQQKLAWHDEFMKAVKAEAKAHAAHLAKKAPAKRHASPADSPNRGARLGMSPMSSSPLRGAGGSPVPAEKLERLRQLLAEKVSRYAVALTPRVIKLLGETNAALAAATALCCADVARWTRSATTKMPSCRL